MWARWSYQETVKLDSIMEKEYEKLELELSAESFRVSERPKEMDSNPDDHQKTNIVSGCPRHLDIQKGLGWDLVLRGTSAGSWVRWLTHPKRIEMSSRRPAKGEKPLEKVVCIPKENWSGVQATSMELRRSWNLEMIPALWLSSLNEKIGGRKLERRSDWYLTS